MRLTRTGSRIVVTDTPGLHWLLAGLFVVGGAAALFVAATDDSHGMWPRVAAGGVGAAVLAAGVSVAAAAPGCRAEFDPAAGTARFSRRGLAGGTRTDRPLSRVTAVVLEVSQDGDGDPVYRLAVRADDGETMPLSRAWAHHGVKEVAVELAATLNVPLTEVPGGR